jgi:hypothetical protein
MLIKGTRSRYDQPHEGRGSKGRMTSDNGATPPLEAPGAALYIASLLEELAQLAKSHDLDALAYILDMARLEADQISKRWDGQGGPGSSGPN